MTISGKMIFRRTLYALCCAALLAGTLAAQDKPDDVIKIDTALVNIPVIVSDRDNRYMPGLTKANFRVFQDGAEQTIEVFNNDAAPMNVVLALDTSRSTEGVLGKIKKAAKKFIKDLGPEDRCMVVSFDNDLEILSELTADKKTLERAIKDAEVGENFGTVLQDAVFDAVQRRLRGVNGRKALILLTDGADFGSRISKPQLFDRLTESDSVVYPIFYESRNRARVIFRPQFPDMGGIGRRGRSGAMGRFPQARIPQPPRRSRPNAEANQAAALAFLERLAVVTGGRAFAESKADLDDAFRQIADEMKRQYVIGFYPKDESPAGTEHRIKVQVDRPAAVVRARSAYRTQQR